MLRSQAKAFAKILATAGRRKAGDVTHHHAKPPVPGYDHMVVPREPFQQGYQRNTAEMNKYLAAGIAMWFATTIWWWQVYKYDIYKALPPKAYRDRTTDFYHPAE